MNVNKIINDYRYFLLSSWESFSKFNDGLSHDDIEEKTNNWLQANWEVLVESSLTEINEYLEVYGYGADCNGASSRVCFPNQSPTHKIFCKSLDGDKVRDVISNDIRDITEMTFDGFMNWNGINYDISPPFDFVLLSDKNEEILVSLSNIQFDICRI